MLQIDSEQKIYSQEEILQAFVRTFHKKGEFGFPYPPASELECNRATEACWKSLLSNLDNVRRGNDQL